MLHHDTPDGTRCSFWFIVQTHDQRADETLAAMWERQREHALNAHKAACPRLSTASTNLN